MLPVLVVQVPDKSDAAKIGEIVQVVEAEWPGLGPQCDRACVRRARAGRARV